MPPNVLELRAVGHKKKNAMLRRGAWGARERQLQKKKDGAGEWRAREGSLLGAASRALKLPPHGTKKLACPPPIPHCQPGIKATRNLSDRDHIPFRAPIFMSAQTKPLRTVSISRERLFEAWKIHRQYTNQKLSPRTKEARLEDMLPPTQYPSRLPRRRSTGQSYSP